MLQAQVIIERMKIAMDGLDELFAFESERGSRRELATSIAAVPSIEFDNVTFRLWTRQFRHKGNLLIKYAVRGKQGPDYIEDNNSIAKGKT